MRCRLVAKRDPSQIVATIVAAVIMSTPGIVISRLMSARVSEICAISRSTSFSSAAR